MKAIVLHEAGDVGRLRPEETDDPQPGPDDVVVRIRAAALNHRDLFICTGQYAGLRYPIIPGADGVGTIHAVGAHVTTVKAGQEVVINPSLDWGDQPARAGAQVAHSGVARQRDVCGTGQSSGQQHCPASSRPHQ